MSPRGRRLLRPLARRPAGLGRGVHRSHAGGRL